MARAPGGPPDMAAGGEAPQGAGLSQIGETQKDTVNGMETLSIRSWWFLVLIVEPNPHAVMVKRPHTWGW